MTKKTLLIPLLCASLMLSSISVFFILLNNRSSFYQKPEDDHLIGDGIYFNIFTEETRDCEVTGVFSEVDDTTVFYASIQNSGKNRHVKLKGYLNYTSVPLEIIDASYNGDDIYLSDGSNIIIPFKIQADIDPNKNYKLLLSLFLGTDQHEDTTHYQTAEHTLSYDYFIQNNTDNRIVELDISKDSATHYIDSDFPSIVLNTDFTVSDSVKLPPYKFTVNAGEQFELAYKIGHIKSDSTMLLVTIDYEQATINNNATSLLVDTPYGKLASGTISLTAPNTAGQYEICAVAIPNPSLPNSFEPLENAYRFTLEVQ